MKKSAALALVIGFLLAISCADKKIEVSNQPATPKLIGPKKRVGIFAFKNKSRYGQDELTRAAVDILYSELEKSNRFELYERADLNELEKEFDLIESGKVNPASAGDPGKLPEVQAVIIGGITQFGRWEEGKDYGFYKLKSEIAEAAVDIRVVDVATGRIIVADSGMGRVEREQEQTFGFGEAGSYDETMADQALRAAIDQFIANLIERLNETPWEGKVADTDMSGGQQIIAVNAGRKSLMPMGAKLVIFKITGKITDPDTGALLGYKTQSSGSAEVYEFSGEDLFLARVTSGGAQKGDLVVLEGDAGKF